MIFQKYKKWIIITLVIVAAFLIYTFFFTGGEESDSLLVANVQQTPAEIVGDEIISALNQIESLSLDRAIFDNPVYQSLKDRSQEIPPEPIGKANPFDPISSSAPEVGAPRIEDQTSESAEGSSGRGPTTIIRPPASPSGGSPVI